MKFTSRDLFWLVLVMGPGSRLVAQRANTSRGER
jgi:hypothetical protein